MPAAVTLMVLLVVLLPQPLDAAPAGANWSAYLFNPTHSSRSPASAITVANAPTLAEVWNWVPDPPTHGGQPGPLLFSSPTVWNGQVFIGADTGDFYSLDLRTGGVLWKRFIGFATAKTCAARGFVSTATVAIDPVSLQPTVYVGAADGFLYAMDAGSGLVVWKSLVVDPGTTQNEGFNWTSPAVSRGRVYMGMSSQCDSPLIQGGVKEFDQATGALLATWFSTPPGVLGGSVWSSVGVTNDGRSVLVTTGNSPGATGDSYSIVRLDASTLAKVSSWMVPDVLGTDDDFGASPALYTVNIGRTPTPVVAACNKNGILYGLDRRDISAGPIWSIRVSEGDEVPGGGCFPAPVWDGTHLFQASGLTQVGTTTFPGSVRQIDPTTGTEIWLTTLTGPVFGTPSVDAAGVLVLVTYDPRSSTNAAYLLDASDGAIVASLGIDGGAFAQPVFAENLLLIASQFDGLSAYTPQG